MRKHLSRVAALTALSAAGLAIASAPGHALAPSTGGTDTSQDDLKKKGYKCEVVATDFIECKKDGETTYWCSNRGKTCVKKPLSMRPSSPTRPLAQTFSVALTPQP
jgi:hypothetical protein